MSIKLFVTDLDGTLLVSASTVSKRNIAAAQAAAKAGVTVTIATGRMYKAALPVAQALGVDVPIITYNGALIKTTSGKELYAAYLPPEVVAEVASFAQERGWYIQSYSHDELLFPVYDEHSRGYEQAQAIKGRLVGWDGLRSPEYTQAVSKMLCITDDESETEQRIREFNDHFGGRIVAVRSKADYAEITCPGVSKASGIQRLAERLGISIDETMAIGDGDNDIPMLKAAGHSVAMGNAVPEVKAICDYVTGDCEADGFAAAIEKYVLGQG